MKRCVITLHCCVLFSCALPQDDLGASRFDGDWQALMHETQAVQQVMGLQFNCAPFTESFFLRVKDGAIAGFMEADENYSFKTPIDGNGRFRALIPTNSVYNYQDAEFSRESNIVLVLKGRLSAHARSGEFVIGDSALNGQGCSTRVQFVSV